MKNRILLALTAFSIYIGCGGTSVETEGVYDKDVRPDLQSLANAVTVYPGAQESRSFDVATAPAIKRSATSGEGDCPPILLTDHRNICENYDSEIGEYYYDTLTFYKADGITATTLDEINVAGKVVIDERNRTVDSVWDYYTHSVYLAVGEASENSLSFTMDEIVGNGHIFYKAHDFLLAIDTFKVVTGEDSIVIDETVSFLNHKYTCDLRTVIKDDGISTDFEPLVVGKILDKKKKVVGTMHVKGNKVDIFDKDDKPILPKTIAE